MNRSINGIPEATWTNEKINLNSLQIFGTMVMVHVPKEKRKKWDVKSKQMIFVGYSETQKGFRCYDRSEKKVVVSRDVVFLESKEARVSDCVNINFDEDIVSVEVVGADDNNENCEARVKDGQSSSSLSNLDESVYDDCDRSSDDDYVPTGRQLTPPNTSIRKSERNPKPKQDRDYVYSTFSAIENTLSDPQTVSEAMSRYDREQWKHAMDDELKSLVANNTWTLTDLPQGRKPLKVKWVFKVKYSNDGAVIRHKARLVAKGCSQKRGIDYNETFSPVVRYTSIRILIAMAAKMRLGIDQMDAITAYLQGDLEEEIYIEQPDGFSDKTGRVCKLNKAMYGLKQSGRQWNRRLDTVLQSFGLLKSKVDPCVYFTKAAELIIAIYVDDFLIFWKNECVRDKLKKALSEVFHMKDMGTARQCVGLNIVFSKEGISIDQSKYASEILEKYSMAESKPATTPSENGTQLSVKMIENEDVTGTVPYQAAVGSILYLAQGSRPDIAFAVNDVSRFNDRHGKEHWTAVKRIMRYIKQTVNYCILYRYSDDGDLHGYCDSDFASDVDKRRSCTGFVFKLAEGAVSWGSKRQQTVALSTTEAEYMAMSFATQEAIWLRQFINQFGIQIPPIVMLCDNQSAMAVAKEDSFRARTKHIDVKHHHIRDQLTNGVITIEYVSTNENVADVLTKAVSGLKQKYCSTGMGLKPDGGNNE